MTTTVIGALAKVRMAACNPGQPAAGPPPASFVLVKSWPSGPEFDWPTVPGAVAYLVERAIDNGAYQWQIVGSTCGQLDDIRAVQYGDGTTSLRFRDIAGGVVPGTRYVYKVSAVGPAAELGWNSTRWTAPAQAPNFNQAPEIVGSTVKLWFEVLCATDMSQVVTVTAPTEVLITSSYGFSAVYANGSACHHLMYPVNGVPISTHTFTITSHWLQSLDPSRPAVIPTGGTTASISVEIKP